MMSETTIKFTCSHCHSEFCDLTGLLAHAKKCYGLPVAPMDLESIALVKFATEILDQFYPERCPHCQRDILNWAEYIDIPVIETFVKSYMLAKQPKYEPVVGVDPRD